MNLISALVICFQIANKKQGCALNFKGLSQDGGRTYFSENLRTSLFNKYPSNEPNFSRIHSGWTTYGWSDIIICTVLCKFNASNNQLTFYTYYLLYGERAPYTKIGEHKRGERGR